jgi:FMN phosphatase YigB (HAD superfamily)
MSRGEKYETNETYKRLPNREATRTIEKSSREGECCSGGNHSAVCRSLSGLERSDVQLCDGVAPAFAALIPSPKGTPLLSPWLKPGVLGGASIKHKRRIFSMPSIVFLLDVDNTLLDNDSVKANLDQSLQADLGPALTKRFWNIYEQIRHEKGVVDIPATLRRFREQTTIAEMDEQIYLHIRSLFEHYPFNKALYPYALETIEHLKSIGQVVIVSDGDLCFQAEKIFNSALADAVEGRILLYIHKQEHLHEIMQRYPADHYVIIDDKAEILADMKKRLGPKITTVFVKQGKYAARKLPEHFMPDRIVDHIGDLRSYTAEQFLSPDQG